MITFKQHLIETTEDTSEYLFNFQNLILKLIPKLELINQSTDSEYIPNKQFIEFMDLIQLIKQLIVDNINNEEFINLIYSDMKESLNIIYRQSNITELLKVINIEILEKINNFGVDKLKNSLNLSDISMNSEDIFGELLYRIYSKELKNSKDLTSQDLNYIKTWINLNDSDGQSFTSKINNRIRRKNKLFLNINKGSHDIEI